MPEPRDSGLTPTERTPAEPTPVRNAVPGRRDEMSSDARITSRIERHHVEMTPPPLPPPPSADDAKQWLARARATAEQAAAPAPSVDLTAPMPQRGAPPWVFPLLLAVTALVVGMVLGALLFGHRGASCPPPKPQGVQGSISPTSSSRADDVTALYTATDRRSA